MAEETKGATSTVKSKGFVFDDAIVERRLGFKPDPELNHLCLGWLRSWEIVETEKPKYDDSGKEDPWEYAGISVPTMKLEFEQKTLDGTKRYYTHVLKVVVAKDNNGNPIDEKNLRSILKSEFDQARHILNAFVGLKNYDEKLSSSANIKLEFDPDASPKARAESFRKFFNALGKALNGKGERPMYEDILLWMKLPANYKTRRFFAFPQFVGRGFIERLVEGVEPKIEFEGSETWILNKDTESPTEQAASVDPSATTTTPVDSKLQDILNKYK